MSAQAARGGGGFFAGLVAVIGTLRWAFLPLAMGALVAVGAHAAADVLDDGFLALADRVDAAFDALVSRWELTRPLVDLVELEERTWLARALALSFELWADVLVALRMLGYDERIDELSRARELLRRAALRPTVLRSTRGPIALVLALAGAASAARLVRGEVFVTLRSLLTTTGAGASARFLSIAVVVLLVVTIVWRVGLRGLEHADQKSEPRTPRTVVAGTLGTLGLLPLAIAALLRASPLLSFLR